MAAAAVGPQSDVAYLVGKAYATPHELAKDNQLETRIKSVANNLKVLNPDDFKGIPLKLKVRIFEQFQGDQKEQASKVSGEKDALLEKFLANDDELEAKLYEKGLFKGLIAKHCLKFSPDGQTFTLFSRFLSPAHLIEIVNSIPSADKEKVNTIVLNRCKGLTDLSVLKGFSNATTLSVPWAFDLTSLKGVQNCPKLTSIDASHCGRLAHVDDLRDHQFLTNVNVSDCAALSSIAGIGVACGTSLKTLDISHCPSLADYRDVIPKLLALVSLRLRHLANLFDLNLVKGLPALADLDFSYTRVADITGIMNKKLQLTYTGCTHLRPQALEWLSKLQHENSSQAAAKK